MKTLFLDRDGVINQRLPGAYVRHWDEFTFLPGVLPAIALLRRYFDRIVVVTNQQGIGKHLMTDAELHAVHQKMLQEIKKAGGHLDGIYFCPDLKSKPDNCRKPAPAMAIQAQRDYPAISFSQSVMVGDSASDMAFGRQLGMQTVLIETNGEEIIKLTKTPDWVDQRFPSLWAFAKNVERRTAG